MAQNLLLLYLGSVAIIFVIVAVLVVIFMIRARSRVNVPKPGAPAINEVEEAARLGEQQPGTQRSDPRGVDIGGTFSDITTRQEKARHNPIHHKPWAS